MRTAGREQARAGRARRSWRRRVGVLTGAACLLALASLGGTARAEDCHLDCGALAAKCGQLEARGAGSCLRDCREGDPACLDSCRQAARALVEQCSANVRACQKACKG